MDPVHPGGQVQEAGSHDTPGAGVDPVHPGGQVHETGVEPQVPGFPVPVVELQVQALTAPAVVEAHVEVHGLESHVGVQLESHVEVHGLESHVEVHGLVAAKIGD